MEKMILTAAVDETLYEYNREVKFGDEAVHVRRAIPRREKEELALELAAAALVFDEEQGTVYEGYNHDLAEMILMMKYYTNLDLTAYDTADGRYLLWDILDSHGALAEIRDITMCDLCTARCLYDDICRASRETFEKKHGLGQLIKQTLGSILGSEDIATTFAKAQDINSSLIDMMGALKREKDKKPAGGLVSFAKRDV